MKIKSLPINVLTVLLGVSFLLFASKSFANNAEKSPLTGQFYNQDGDELQKHQVTGKINIEDVIAARQQAGLLHAKGEQSLGLNWIFKGPNDLSGKISSVIFDNKDSNQKTVYAGSAHGGGVWKSMDMGVNWTRTTTADKTALYVTCLDQSSTGTIYVGTGGDFPGQGIYKSTNGMDFSLVPGTNTWHTVYSICVIDDSKIYAGTNNGLMFFNGSEWSVCTATKEGLTVALDGAAKSVAKNKNGSVIASVNKLCYIATNATATAFKYSEINFSSTITSLSVAISDKNTCYASAANSSGQLEGAYRSDDMGDSWVRVFAAFVYGGGGTDPLSGNGNIINTINIDPVNDSIIYIASTVVWKGQRFAPTGYYDFGYNPLSSYNGSYNSPYYMHSGINNISFGKPRDNSRTLMIATNGGVYYADVNVSTNVLSPSYRSKTLNSASFSNIAVNTKGNILGGTPYSSVQAIGDPGTNYIQNARAAWSMAAETNNYSSEGDGGKCAISLVNEAFYIYSRLAVTPNPEGAALNYVNTVRRSENYGFSFQPTGEGDATINWTPSDVYGGTSQSGTKYKTPFIMWETFNASFTPDTVCFKADTARNYRKGDNYVFARSENFQYPMKYDLPQGNTLNHGDSVFVPDVVQNRFYICANGKVFMTRDALKMAKTDKSTNKIAWYQIGKLNARDTANCLAITADGDNLFVGTKSGNIYKASNLIHAYDTKTADISSADRVVTFDLIATYSQRIVTSIITDPDNSSHIVITLGNYGNNDYVFETTDVFAATVSFNSIQQNLPKAPVYTGIISKGDNLLMVGTETGIYYRSQGETAWTAETNLENYPVYDIIQVITTRPAVNGVYKADPTSTGNLITENYPDNHDNLYGIYASTFGAGTYESRKYVNLNEVDPSHNGIVAGKGALKVVPNPVKNIATIALDLKSGEQAKVQIFDISGRCVQENIATTNAHAIDFNQLVPGMYIIRVTQKSGVTTGKVIKN